MEERQAEQLLSKNRSDVTAPEAGGSARLILASSSPRRLDLLRSLGLGFDVIPSHADEAMKAGEQPAELVVRLALAKAREVADLVVKGEGEIVSKVEQGVTTLGVSQSAGAPTLVLGSDTIVVLDDDILGKPGSSAEACTMLSRLSGRCHRVFTGVAMIELPQNEVVTGFEVSNVYFRKMEPAEIESYVATEEPMDKAGAYALQGTGSAFVERIEGCFTNIIGLPIPLVVTILRRLGVSVLGLP